MGDNESHFCGNSLGTTTSRYTPPPCGLRCYVESADWQAAIRFACDGAQTQLVVRRVHMYAPSSDTVLMMLTNNY